MQSTWQVAGMVLASALFWMQYVDLKDRLRPEPRKRLLIAFLLGIVAWLIALLFLTACDVLGVPDPHRGGKWWTAAYCLLLIGPVEEGAKILLAYLFVFGWREFDEPIDGFVYAAAISLGFASVENSCNLPDLPFGEQLARTAALPLTHTLFGAVWGFGIARARLRMAPGSRRTLWQAASAALGMELHGLYAFLLFAYNATLFASALMLTVWIFVIWRARVLVKQPRLAAPKTEHCTARRRRMKE